MLKICSPIRPAYERRALIVHEASDMDTEEQRSERTTAGRRQSIFRQHPQEHDERTVSESHSLLFNNSLVLWRFSIYLSCKYTKSIWTKYSLYMCKKCAYFLPLVVFMAGILCCTLCKQPNKWAVFVLQNQGMPRLDHFTLVLNKSKCIKKYHHSLLYTFILCQIVSCSLSLQKHLVF